MKYVVPVLSTLLLKHFSHMSLTFVHTPIMKDILKDYEGHTEDAIHGTRPTVLTGHPFPLLQGLYVRHISLALPLLGLSSTFCEGPV